MTTHDKFPAPAEGVILTHFITVRVGAELTLTAPEPGDPVSSFLNVRVEGIYADQPASAS